MVREKERLLDQRINVDETIVLVSAEDLERDSLVKIAKLYADVFAPPPWNEAFKCDRCDRFAGLETIKGSSCECGGKHTEAYPLEETVDYIVKEAQKDGFRMAIVRDDEEDIVGFSWSYLTTIDEVAEGKWSEANDIEKVKEILGYEVGACDKIRYFSECGVDPAMRGRGLANVLTNAVSGPESTVYRTNCFSPMMAVAGKFDFRQVMGPEVIIDRERRLILETGRHIGHIDSQNPNRTLFVKK